MTITLDFVTIIQGITHLSIPGVDIKDAANIPEGGMLITPVLFPRPDNFITGFTPTVETFGFNGTEQITASYTLNYRYLHCTLGGMAGLYSTYESFLENVEAILEAILNDDTITGATNVRFGTIPAMGTVMDNAGNTFLGCDITIEIEEYTGGA
jgi:hypothetical protein